MKLLIEKERAAKRWRYGTQHERKTENAGHFPEDEEVAAAVRRKLRAHSDVKPDGSSDFASSQELRTCFAHRFVSVGEVGRDYQISHFEISHPPDRRGYEVTLVLSR